MAQYISDGSTGYECDLDNLIQAVKGNRVLSGGAVTAQGSPNMTVAIAQGYAVISGDVQAPAPVASQAITAADPSNARLDIIYLNTGTGVYGYTAGTPAATPKPPSLPAGYILFAIISVAAGAVNIQNSNISDRRITSGDGIAGGSLLWAATGGGLALDTDTGELSRYNLGTTSWQNVANRYPNLVLNSDFARRTVWGLAMPEVFADTSGYLRFDAGTAPTVSANILTQGAAGNWEQYPISGYSTFWRDGRASATFKAVSTTGTYEIFWHVVDANNVTRVQVVNGSFRLSKYVAGVNTDVATIAQALTLNRWYWLEIESQGTTYIVKIYDTGGTVPGVTKTSSTLLQTLTGTIADAAVQLGGVGIRSDQSNTQWGGIAASPGGVYVETWLPESWSVTFGGTLGGQALGYDESTDAGPLNKRAALRGYIPAASRTVNVAQNLWGAEYHLYPPSTTFNYSGYMKVSGKGGSGTLLQEGITPLDDAGASQGTSVALVDAAEAAWTRKNGKMITNTLSRGSQQVIYFNPSSTATGTAWVDLLQLEQGSAATAWRNAPADDAPITWMLSSYMNTITSTATSDTEIDSRMGALNAFLPWDATVACEIQGGFSSTVAGDQIAVSAVLDTAIPAGDLAAGRMFMVNIANYVVPVHVKEIGRQAAGKHRIAIVWRRIAGTGTMGIDGYAPIRLIITATRGK